MLYTIKNNISFDEYYSIINRVISDCFVDEVYSPAMYNLSFRNALISVFCPDFDLSGCEYNNSLWEKLMSKECSNILDEIQEKSIYDNIHLAISQGINHRLRVIESSPMSLSDIALSKLFSVIADKIDSVDTDVMNKTTIEALIAANQQSGKEDFVGKLVDTMVEKGLVSKPNRATRRSNSKKNNGTKIVKIDTVNQDENESK